MEKLKFYLALLLFGGLISLPLVIMLLNKRRIGSEKREIKYVIFYPGQMDTVTDSGFFEYEWGSTKGTNYIQRSDGFKTTEIYSGSSPFKIISYERSCLSFTK